LRKIGEIDVFLSGSNAHLQFPFEATYKSRGLSFMGIKASSITDECLSKIVQRAYLAKFASSLLHNTIW
jgi:hypothetical protein